MSCELSSANAVAGTWPRLTAFGEGPNRAATRVVPCAASGLVDQWSTSALENLFAV